MTRTASPMDPDFRRDDGITGQPLSRLTAQHNMAPAASDRDHLASDKLMRQAI
jgi:hypothetical protein